MNMIYPTLKMIRSTSEANEECFVVPLKTRRKCSTTSLYGLYYVLLHFTMVRANSMVASLTFYLHVALYRQMSGLFFPYLF